MTTEAKKEFLSTRVCRLLQTGDKTPQEMQPVLNEPLKRVRQACLLLKKGKFLTDTKIRHGVIRYHLICAPRNKDFDPVDKPAKKTKAAPPAPAKSGVIAPRPRGIDFSTTLRRDPFEAWRMCQRDPVTSTQSAVFSFKR